MTISNDKMSEIIIDHMQGLIKDINEADPEGATPRQYTEHLANMVVSTLMTIADTKLEIKGTNHDKMMEILRYGFLSEFIKQYEFQTQNKNQGLE